MRNLCIDGEDEGVDEFTVVLGPGENTYKILRSIDRNYSTSLGMRYSYN